MTFRFFSLLILVAITTSSQAQDKFIDHLSIKGGFLFDEHTYYNEQSESFRNFTSKNNYSGFNYISVGLNVENGKKVYGLEVEFSHFEIIPPMDPIGIGLEIGNWNRSKWQTNLIAYYGRALVYTKSYQFIAAPIASLSYSKEDNIPRTTLGFPVNISKATLGLGIKLQNQFWLTKKIGVSVGSRFILVDAGLEFIRTENPALPLRTQRQGGFGIDLIREEFLLQMGINYKI